MHKLKAKKDMYVSTRLQLQQKKKNAKHEKKDEMPKYHTNFSLYKLHCIYIPPRLILEFSLIIPLLPLKLQPLPITRLTTVRPSTLLLLFLVAAQTRA